MTRKLNIAFAAFCLAPALLTGQPAQKSPQPTGQKIPFPCKLTDYKIPDPKVVRVYCGGASLKKVDASKVQLFRIVDDSVTYPAMESQAEQVLLETTGDNLNGEDRQYWLKFTFATPLTADQDYEIRVEGTVDHGVRLKDPFDSTRFRFSTRQDVEVGKVKGRDAFALHSHFRLTVADGTGSRGTLRDDNAASFTLENHKDLADADVDVDTIGHVGLKSSSGTGAPEIGKTIVITGLTDVFGRKITTVKPPKPAPPAAAPKDKQSADWYFNFLHQAGVGISPTWIAVVKMAPSLGKLPAGLVVNPSLDIDIGTGAVNKTKTSDLINPKIGVSRVVRGNMGILEGGNFTWSASYVTNRAGNQNSLLFDQDTRIYLRGLKNTQAERTRDAFLAKQKEKNGVISHSVLPQDAPKAFFGYNVQLFVGSENGASLSDNTVKSSDKTSSVVVPVYGIHRFRSHASASFEFARFTLSLSTIARDLLTAETVTREVSTLQSSGKVTKTIVLKTVSGWRPYSEVALNYSIDPAGHYSINTVYKSGSQPPNFDRTNVVQSGILIRF